MTRDFSSSDRGLLGLHLGRVRWGAVVAGLFVAFATMAVLSVLGLAIGLSAYDYGDNPRPFSVGAGIWSILSAIIAFCLGGYVASRTSLAYNNEGTGTLNGVMVWAVAIPLLVYFLGTGLGHAPRMAGTAHSYDVAMPASARMDASGAAVGNANPAGRPISPAAAAWWSLVALLLGLGASALGGYWGAGGDLTRDVGHATGTHTATTGTSGGVGGRNMT
jgi:hypothetical protein